MKSHPVNLGTYVLWEITAGPVIIHLCEGIYTNFRSVPPIRTEDDCQIYIRACSIGPNKTSCLRTASYSFMHNYTGGLAFSLEDKTKNSVSLMLH